MNGIVQISCLGSYGRWGNQCFQYAFARAYAESIGAQLETPAWVGQDLFEDVKDPPLSCNLPTLSNDEHPEGATNLNLHGYFQYARCFDYYTIRQLRKWFTFRKDILEKYLPADVGVAIHLRRGDYLSMQDLFCTVSLDSYRSALITYGFDPGNIKIVGEINPTAVPVPGAEWLGDFLTLYAARILFRANSTFSWWAGTLGQHAEVYSPMVEGLHGCCENVQFVEGNYPRCVSLPNVSDYHIKP